MLTACTQCCLLYRGDVVSGDIANTLDLLREENRVRFVDWSPCGFKCGINAQPMRCVPESDFAAVTRSVCMVSSCTAIRDVFAKVESKFDLMYQKKAFVHWCVFHCQLGNPLFTNLPLSLTRP
jgi:tubulin alpha